MPLRLKGSEALGLFGTKNKKDTFAAAAVQTGSFSAQPFRALDFYTPMSVQGRVYAALREGVPLIDAAISKIVRLVMGFHFETGRADLDNRMQTFFSRINVGGNQMGLSAFMQTYLEQLLTYGTAVGEIIPAENTIAALYNGELETLEIKRAPDGLGVDFYNSGTPLPHPERILFSVLNPEPGHLLGTSLLRGLPFVSRILLQIYNTIGENWAHAGNLRYAVTYKPGTDSTDRAYAKERAAGIAASWQEAMSADTVRDFVAVGDVDIKVIGADNMVLDSEIPVRQLLEQIIAKTGLPPFMFGLNWSTTERMSTQQADILTSELEQYRRILDPVLQKIGCTYLRMQGIACDFDVVWDDITLQDQTEAAKAALYFAQADQLKTEEKE